MCIIAFSLNFIGSRAPNGVGEGCLTLSPADIGGGKKSVRGTPRQRLTGQAGCFATRKVVRLSLVQREDVPVRILSRTAPELIASRNAAGTPGRLD